MVRKPTSGPAWQVVLEEIRSHNRATIEAVESSRQAVEERLGRLEQDLRTRTTLLEDTIKALDRDSRSRDTTLELEIRELKIAVQQNTVDGRDLTRRFEVLTRLEERVAALEKTAGSNDHPATV